MRQRTNRDEVGAGRCDLRDPFERHAARYFDQRPSLRSPDSFADLIERHVVDKDGVRARCERLVYLIEPLGFDFDVHAGARGMHPVERGSDAAGEANVIFLDEHRVEQAETMVRRAARPHRVLLERAQPGRRLAGIEHRDSPAGRVDELPRPRGDARQTLQEIERGPLADQQRARRCGDFGDRRTGPAVIAVAPDRLERRRRTGLDLAERLERDIQAGDDFLKWEYARELLGAVRRRRSEAKQSMKVPIVRAVIADAAERLARLDTIEADLRSAGRIATIERVAREPFEVNVEFGEASV